MITLDAGTDHFSYRVAALAVEDGHVLLHTATHETFWRLPGRKHPCSRNVRGMALDVEVGRLVFVVENFFGDRDRDYHQLLFIHEMSLPGGLSRDRDQIVHRLSEQTYGLEFRWHAADEGNLSKIGLLPAFLRQRLSALPAGTEHVVWRNQ